MHRCVPPRMDFRPARFVFAASAFATLAAVACSSPSDATESDGETQEALNEAKALGMTDVTILYPLPKSVDFFDDKLGPTSEVDQGELLPADLFTQIAAIAAPPMTTFDGKQMEPNRALFADWVDAFSYLRVVGIRLDPCFGGAPASLGATDCMNTIRMVAQFFPPNTNSSSPLPDGRSAIHLFYKVTRQDFTALAKGMLALRKASGLPLQKGLITTSRGVHPTLAAEGLRGTYATGLKDLILKYAGEQTLTQIAVCVQDRGAPLNGYYNNSTVADSRWVFGRFEYAVGALRPLDVSTLNYTGLQTIDTSPPNGQRDMVVVTPVPTVPDNFLQFFNRKPEASGTVDPVKVDNARRSSFTLMNPKKYTAKTADCASCHMAKQVVINHPSDPNDYKSSTYRLDHTHDFFGPFRMFGYDGGANPILSARVVNETATVLDYLNKVVMR